VTFDVARAVKEIKGGKVEFRVEKAGIVHAPLGKISFGVEKLIENARSLLDVVMRAKPPTSKGVYLKGIALSTTMGPGIRVDPLQVRSLLK
jgi:large subunit ribosomal protein L1